MTKNQLRDDSSRQVAEIVGVSSSLVHKVRNGERDNDNVMATLVEWNEKKQQIIKELKDKQELYKKAAETGRLSEAYALEDRIDELQAEFLNTRKELLSQFYAD